MAYQKKKDGLFYSPERGRVMEHRGYATRIFWNKQMLDDLRRMFPTTLNEELAGFLCVSQRTMVRKARELGLVKDPRWLRDIWEERRKWAHMASAAQGHPGGFQKGQRANPAGEFKPGHKPTAETIAKQAAGRRKWNMLNPDKVRARVLKAAETRKRKRENQKDI